MRKILITMAVSVVGFMQAQSAEQIISTHIEKTGGLLRWKKLNTISLKGQLLLGKKDKYPLRIFQSRPNLARTNITVNGKEITLEGYDGKRGYAMNYATGSLQPYEKYVPDAFDNDFLEYAAKGFTATVVGKAMLEGKPAWKIELTKNTNRDYYYFDTESYMLVREETQGQSVNYADFRAVEGYIFPFKISGISKPENTPFTMIFSQINTNAALPAATFKF